MGILETNFTVYQKRGFKYVNKNNLVIGLPKNDFSKYNICSVCQLGRKSDQTSWKNDVMPHFDA